MLQGICSWQQYVFWRAVAYWWSDSLLLWRQHCRILHMQSLGKMERRWLSMWFFTYREWTFAECAGQHSTCYIRRLCGQDGILQPCSRFHSQQDGLLCELPMSRKIRASNCVKFERHFTKQHSCLNFQLHIRHYNKRTIPCNAHSQHFGKNPDPNGRTYLSIYWLV